MPIKDKIKHNKYMQKYRMKQEIKHAKQLHRKLPVVFLNNPNSQVYMGYPIPILHKEFYDRTEFKGALDALFRLEQNLIEALNLSELIIVEDVTVRIDGDLGRVYERVAIPPDKQGAFNRFLGQAGPIS